jgi:3-deoxy-D-manno-octulosonic acid kinase
MLERIAIDRGAILFDPRRADVLPACVFDLEHWHARGALTERPGGRGSVHFIEDGKRHWVLRRYLRGGMAASFASDRYLFTGAERTRSFRELRLLEAMRERDLPVPAPVAARYRRSGAAYRAELVTERLPGARSLQEAIAAGEMDDARWAAVGRCLRHFHDAGVQHADLNMRNIMLGEHREVWVLDFDRGRLRQPGAWSRRVLDRLGRSIEKACGDAGDWKIGFELLRLAHDA